jgi:hypothetical protein
VKWIPSQQKNAICCKLAQARILELEELRLATVVSL